MMRVTKMINKINFKYILSEIFLIFIGISLAIWFNNWNQSERLSKHKDIVIQRVKEEIKSNLDDLTNARSTNQRLISNYEGFARFLGDTPNEVIVTKAQMRNLQKGYPDFFILQDSTLVGKEDFFYRGEINIDLEIMELNNIAWKTAQSLDIANEFSYSCLYQLESVYNLQSKVMNGYDKVTNTLGDLDGIRKLIRWLKILSQYEIELEEDYRSMLEEIELCR